MFPQTSELAVPIPKSELLKSFDEAPFERWQSGLGVGQQSLVISHACLLITLLSALICMLDCTPCPRHICATRLLHCCTPQTSLYAWRKTHSIICFTADDQKNTDLTNKSYLLRSSHNELFINTQLKGFCNLPQTLVSIETGSSAPIHRRPVPIANAKRPIITKQVQDWLKSGTINRLSEHPPWINALLIALEKDIVSYKQRRTR